MIDQTVENVPRLSEPSLSSLVGGIINDFQSLMKQEVALARRELADELRKAKQAAISLGIGVGILAIGGLLLIFMLVHLLSWAVPAIPLPRPCQDWAVDSVRIARGCRRCGADRDE